MTRSNFDRRAVARGFTLVEILVVMAIFSIVLLAVFSLIIPTQKAAVTQTRVADLQQGLRLAVNVMTKDLLMAGFLVVDDDGPIVFQGNPNMALSPPSDADDFTIRTRIVGNAFGRLVSDSAADADLVIGDDDTSSISAIDRAMDRNFPNGCRVRIFDPFSANEVTPGVVYTVVNTDPDDGLISVGNHPTFSAETVIVRLTLATSPALQTVRYRVNNGALERIVNGTPQVLATDVAGVNFTYDWTSASSPPRKVRRVDILLQGRTRGTTNQDLLSGAKERDVRTSVTLRNVF